MPHLNPSEPVLPPKPPVVGPAVGQHSHLKTDSLADYMEWVDANIDIVAVDGSVFFRSSRLKSK